MGLAFNHAMIYSRDVGRALEFYAGKLGFKMIEKWERYGKVGYARLRAPRGGSTIALHALDSGQKLRPDSEGLRLYFEVRDLEQFCKKLEEAGVELSEPPRMMPWGWKHAYLKDPDGHELSLYWAGAKRLRASAK